MSTKTSIKRIAAVAAAALAIGGFSAVSAHAVDGTFTPSTTASTQTLSLTNGTYGILRVAANVADKYYTITSSGTGSVLFPSATPDTTTALSASSATTELWYSGATPGAAVFGSSKTLDFSVYSATAGTQTVSVVGDNKTGAQTIVITWGAAPVFSAANSTAIIKSMTTGAATSASSVATAAGSATTNDTIVSAKGVTQVAAIYLTVKNNVGAGTGIATGSFSATVTGSGLVTGRGSGTAVMDTAGTRSATSFPDSNGIAAVYVYGDNTAGTGTITITYTDAKAVTSAFTVKTVVFTGTTPVSMTSEQSSYVATAGQALGSADTGAGDGAITAILLDANGNPVAGKTTAGSSVSAGWYLASDNVACITTTLADANISDGSVTVADGVNNLLGTYNLQVTAAAGAVSGCIASVTPHFYVDATHDLAGSAINFTVGGTKITTISLVADADSYAPGDKVKLSVVAKDASGNPIADGYYGVWYNASHLATGSAAPITTSASLTSVPFGKTYALPTGATAGDAADIDANTKKYYFSNGAASASFYAPYADGAVTLTSTLAAANSGTVHATTDTPSGMTAALLGTTLSTKINVVNPASAASQAAIDAAQEATDAANAAYDAANNAMDSADAATAAAQDASDNASAALAAVTSLSATVAKLVKSVAAIAAALAKVQKKIGA